MSDENAEKAISYVSHALEMWFGSQLAGWPDNPTKYFGTPAREAVMAGRASRDAEVESLRRQIADAAEYLAGVKEADDSELQYRDEVEIPALRQQLAESEHNRDVARHMWGEIITEANGLREQLAERDAVIERVHRFIESLRYGNNLKGWTIAESAKTIFDTAPSSTLDALIREKQAEALEAFKSVVRGEGEPRHGGEWVSVNHVEDLLDERAAEYRNGADHE